MRHGISVPGIRHVVTQFGIGPTTTTSDLCQLHIKPNGGTVPPGWTDDPEVTNAEKGYYKHTYVKDHTAQRLDAAPNGTKSMCEVLLENPETARFVGKPNRFLSHAWLFVVLNLLAGLEDYVSGLPEGEPEPFFWFDCFSLDQHAQSTQGSEWWRDTFMRAIGEKGHTVMLLSPWNKPIPLTSAW